MIGRVGGRHTGTSQSRQRGFSKQTQKSDIIKGDGK